MLASIFAWILVWIPRLFDAPVTCCDASLPRLDTCLDTRFEIRSSLLGDSPLACLMPRHLASMLPCFARILASILVSMLASILASLPASIFAPLLASMLASMLRCLLRYSLGYSFGCLDSLRYLTSSMLPYLVAMLPYLASILAWIITSILASRFASRFALACLMPRHLAYLLTTNIKRDTFKAYYPCRALWQALGGASLPPWMSNSKSCWFEDGFFAKRS